MNIISPIEQVNYPTATLVGHITFHKDLSVKMQGSKDNYHDDCICLLIWQVEDQQWLLYAHEWRYCFCGDCGYFRKQKGTEIITTSQQNSSLRYCPPCIVAGIGFPALKEIIEYNFPNAHALWTEDQPKGAKTAETFFSSWDNWVAWEQI